MHINKTQDSLSVLFFQQFIEIHTSTYKTKHNIHLEIAKNSFAASLYKLFLDIRIGIQKVFIWYYYLFSY